jgi:nicotinate phosphoribosyltransferase
VSVNGRAAVKLSDNPTKAMGPDAAIARYREVFETEDQKAQPVLV